MSIGNIFLAAFSYANPVSGIYIQEFKNAVVFIQIVATPEGKVSGGGEFVLMLPDGSLKDKSFSLEGSLDGDQITLRFNAIFGLGSTLSGTVDGGALRLVSENGQMILLKSDLDTFAQEKSKLAAIGADIVIANKAAKYQAEARDSFDRLTSEGKSLEVNLSKLPQAESDADKFIKQTKQRRDDIVSKIKLLRAKLQFASSDDVGEVESIIGGLISELGGLKSEFEANMHFGAIDYDKLQSRLNNFKSHCDQWMAKYSSTLPLQCKNFQTYVVSYKSSWANMNQKYNEAEKMFVFN